MANVAHVLTVFPTLAQTRREWVADRQLPPHMRALLIWSDLELVRADEEGALSTLSEAVYPPLSALNDGTEMDAPVDLMLTATATVRRGRQLDLLRTLHEVWSSAAKLWLTEVGDAKVRAAQKMLEDKNAWLDLPAALGR